MMFKSLSLTVLLIVVSSILLSIVIPLFTIYLKTVLWIARVQDPGSSSYGILHTRVSHLKQCNQILRSRPHRL